MESLTETLLFILPWILLGTSLIFYGHTITQYTSVRQQLEEAQQNIIFISGKKLEEQSLELEEAKQEAKKWEKLATCPPIHPVPDPIIRVDRGDLKLLCYRTHLPYNGKGRHNPEDIKKSTDEFLKNISSYIYFELTDKGYEAEYYQEIYVSNPKKLHYEKGH